MHRSRRRRVEVARTGQARRLLLLLCLLIGLSSCAFDDGNPWGRLELDGTVRFAPGAERLTPEGWLRTSNDYALELTALSLELGELTVTLSSGAGALSFDPASPPPGYSLCHNGHCHAADGSLPTYAEVEAAVAGGGGAGAAPSVVAELDAVLALSAEPQPLVPAACSGCTVLERGELVLGAVHLHGLVLEARVRDLRTGERARLPEGGVWVRAALALDAELGDGLDGAFDRDAPLGARLHYALALTPALFDGVDWAALPGVPEAIDTAQDLSAETALRDTIQRNLEESESLTVEIERFD